MSSPTYIGALSTSNCNPDVLFRHDHYIIMTSIYFFTGLSMGRENALRSRYIVQRLIKIA